MEFTSIPCDQCLLMFVWNVLENINIENSEITVFTEKKLTCAIPYPMEIHVIVSHKRYGASHGTLTNPILIFHPTNVFPIS